MGVRVGCVFEPLSREPDYAPAFEDTVAEAERRGIAVQTIKAIAVGTWGSGERHATTWYEPLRDQDDIDLAVHWALGREGVFLNTVGDVNLLPRLLAAAETFESRPDDAAMDALVGRRSLTPLFT